MADPQSGVGVFARSRAVFVAAALLATSVFWWSGSMKALDFTATLGEMAHFGLKPPALFAIGTIALQLGGSALVVFGGRWAWIGAAALALFTLSTIPLAHDFWNMSGHEAFLEKIIAQEHLSVIGGLLAAAIAASNQGREAR